MATVVLAGGGTAGHIEPALAVGREWIKNHPADKCIFLGTKSGLEVTLVPAAGFELNTIPRVRISRTPSASWLRVPLDLFASVLSSIKILRKADLLIGFGGYVSAPAYLAAAFTKTPIVIHEANAKPGWANRLGARFTEHLAVAHAVEHGPFAEALLAGLPLRSDVANASVAIGSNWSKARKDAKQRLDFPQDHPLVFIMGGSQGSAAINAVVAQSISIFTDNNLSVLHSVGKLNELPEAVGGYKPVSYVEAMADAYLAADLIIGRSGAVTCSEFRALGRYALFVPLPIGNGEQFVNAASLVADGRAEVISQAEFTPEFISARLLELLAKASQAPIQGDSQDIHSAEKIAALAEFALKS
ncbi:MAG: UDP-N-acetylglucosamine--N-acetylmuramyl-(pentapeptide) pyrophosphoryl-undecaprenol N-acetylglucosamine transferase [Candidatus Planktophila sp.]|nr:UDP-N-acetylglucosamine--N-acetylmuramyl-(pentapeptide) pyrophosphoryl-undecaprenol N-acetylglucosamine transferase [Candidatus Planktophila sp.]